MSYVSVKKIMFIMNKEYKFYIKLLNIFFSQQSPTGSSRLNFFQRVLDPYFKSTIFNA